MLSTENINENSVDKRLVFYEKQRKTTTVVLVDFIIPDLTAVISNNNVEKRPIPIYELSDKTITCLSRTIS